MLTPKHVTALNDLPDNHKPDIIALTETLIRSSTTPANLIDSTSLGYSLFSAPRSYIGNPSNLILAGGTAFLINEPFIHNSASHYYSSFEYSSITLKYLIVQLTLFNVHRPPLPSPYSQPLSTFLNQFSSFLSHAATTLQEFIIAGDLNIHVDDLTDTQIIQFFTSLPVVTSLRMLKFLLTDMVKPSEALDFIITLANTTLNHIITSS